MTEKDIERIFIRNCAVDLSVGIFDFEKARPQRIIVSVELEAALTQHFRDPADADLTKVVDYGRVRNFICKDLPRQGHIHLLETVAEMILDFCFTDPRVLKAQVQLEKPRLFPETESVGITLCRHRTPQA
jgi:dihydroneopterin aldolase